MPPASHREIIEASLTAIRGACNPRDRVAAVIRADLSASANSAIIAVGKAAPAMYQGFCDAAGDDHPSILIVPDGLTAPAHALTADHPIPTPRCVQAAAAVASFVQHAASSKAGCDQFIVLLSGGASSLFAWPVNEIPLPRYADAIKDLLLRGVDIGTLNTIRKHCERLKGGRLAALMHPVPCHTLILSDVIGDELSNVGSGPTLPDPTTFADAIKPFAGDLESSMAARVLLPYLQAGLHGKHAETFKPGDPVFAHSRHTLIGSNSLAVEAAAGQLTKAGLRVSPPRLRITGDAAAAGRALVAEALSSARGSAFVYGGETTVDVNQHSGRGGRNQELALAAAIALDGHADITIAAFATDGVDGPTNAAGAIVTGDTCRQARSIGLDPADFFARHDSHSFFEKLEHSGLPHLIKTGPTGTNVNDVAIAIVS